MVPSCLSNTSLNVAVKVFCRCGQYLQSVDFMQNKLSSIICVDLIQALRAKTEISGEKEILSQDCSIVILPEFPTCQPIDFRFTSSHNHMSQLFKIKLFIYMFLTDSVFLENPDWYTLQTMVCFLWEWLLIVVGKWTCSPSYHCLITICASYGPSWNLNSPSVKWTCWSLYWRLIFRIFNKWYGMGSNQSEYILVKNQLVICAN